MLTTDHVVRFSLMYTTANLALVVLAGALREPWLKGLAACNSLLILAFVYVVQVLYPEDYKRVYRSFAFDASGAILMDFIVHTVPVLIALRWLVPYGRPWQVAAPALAVLMYVSVADVRWIYKVRELEICKVVAYAFTLYAVGLTVCWVDEQRAVWAFLLLAVTVAAVLFARAVK